MVRHDPVHFVRSLSAKLSARARHVCMFLGAGAAKASGLPDVGDLQRQVLEGLEPDARAEFSRQLEGQNLEQAISRLRRIAALVSGDATVDGLTGGRAAELDALVCQAIVDALTVPADDPEPMEHLAAWATRANYRLPLELFTVNYDLLLETALERVRAPYFDGFIGAVAAGFHTAFVEGSPLSSAVPVPASFVRLWKLHGSVNWAWTDDKHIVRLGHPVSDGRPAAIYPSDLKYQESRRVPFIVLQDRFRRALYEPETLLLISGYSFRDDHLNEYIFDAAMHRPRSEFIAFCFGEVPSNLAAHAEVTPNLQVVADREAIVGGVRGPWLEESDDPELVWTGRQFALADFRHLAKYLARSTASQHEPDARTPELGSVTDQARDPQRIGPDDA